MSTEKKRGKPSGKTSFRERLSDALDVPAEMLMHESCINIVGNRSASVTGCTGVLEYSNTCVVLRVLSGTVKIQGNKLEMQSLIDDRITVFGNIENVCVGNERGGVF